jgi:allantoinase
MAYDLLIQNGKVVLENTVAEVEVAVQGGKIAAIGSDLGPAAQVIDAKGLYVLPGVIDGHVHLCEPGRTEWEGFETGTRALAAGGTTCYVDMPLNNLPATIDADTMAQKLAAAQGKNYVDYCLYGGVVPHNLDQNQLKQLDEAGVVGYKAFLSTCGFGVAGDFKNIDDYDLYDAMTQLAALGQMISLHCENAPVCDKLGEKAQAEGRVDMYAYLDSRPIFTEVESVRRALFFARQTGCKTHFVHLSCAEAVWEVLQAKREGMDVTIESCPHYFNLDRDQCKAIGARAKCSPPIRSKEDASALWQELFAGHIDILGSDHSPCPPSMKDTGENLFQAWGGLSACQNMLDMMFDQAVQKRGMCPSQLMRYLSSNVARVFGIPNKGRIAPGYDADLVLLKPNAPYTVKAENLFYRHKHSAYEGQEVGCQVMKTLVRGNTVFERETGIVGAPVGRFVRKAK